MLSFMDNSRRRRRFLRLLCLGLLTIVAACELPQQPGELWWDVDLNMPFGVRTYGMWELAEPDSVLREAGSGVGMNEDSSLYFSAWADLSAALEESLYVDPIDVSIDRYVTAIEAPLDYDTLLSYSLGRLNPEIAALHGTTLDISEHELDGLITLPLPAGYDSFAVDTGTVALVIANRLPYTVRDIVLRAGHVIVANVAELNAEQQYVATASLEGMTQYSVFALSLSGTGIGGSQIAVDSTDRIAVTARIDTVTASQFYGIVPEQTVTRDSALAIEQRHVIDLAIVSGGNMTVTLANHTQFADTVALRIPNMVSRLNDTLRVTQFLQPGDSNVVVVPLAQWRIRPDGDDVQTIRGELISHTPSPAERRAFVGNGERVYASVAFDRLPIEFFSGRLNNLQLDFDSLSVEIERPPQGWEVVRPLEVEARIHVDDGIGGELDATLDAHTWLNGAQVGASTIALENLPLADDTFAVIPGLADLLSEYPNLLTASGSSTLSGEVSVYSNSVIKLGLELRAAMSVVLTDTLEPVGDVERVSPRDLEDIASGTATIKIWNRLPLGGRCYLVADPESLAVLDASGADVDTLFDVAIPRPSVSGGRATDVAEYEFAIELTDHWLNYFQSGDFFVRTQIEAATSVGDTLVLHGGDFIKVQPFAKLVYTVRPGDIE